MAQPSTDPVHQWQSRSRPNAGALPHRVLRGRGCRGQRFSMWRPRPWWKTHFHEDRSPGTRKRAFHPLVLPFALDYAAASKRGDEKSSLKRNGTPVRQQRKRSRAGSFRWWLPARELASVGEGLTGDYVRSPPEPTCRCG